MSSEWLTTVEVAELLGRSDRWVRDRIKEGVLPAMSRGGSKRKSYKIHKEALAVWMLGQEKLNIEEVSKMVEGMEVRTLLDIEGVIIGELKKRGGRRVQIVPKCRAMLKPVVELESRRLPKEFVFEDWAIYERYYTNPGMICSTALDEAAGKAEGHLSIQITTTEFFEALCKGRVHDDYQPPWEVGKTPILYVDCLMLEDPVWTPFLFRHMAGQIKEFCRKQAVRVQGCFAVASAMAAEEILRHYGFVEVAKFEGKFPIMLLRDIYAGKMGAYLR